jgi:hypothetical protein
LINAAAIDPDSPKVMSPQASSTKLELFIPTFDGSSPCLDVLETDFMTVCFPCMRKYSVLRYFVHIMLNKADLSGPVLNLQKTHDVLLACEVKMS